MAFATALRENRQPFVQAKLTIGRPNDKYEQEADAVADQVIKMPSNDRSGIQRKCAECEEEELQMKPLGRTISPIVQKQSSSTASVAPPNISQSLSKSKGSGRPLPQSTQNVMGRGIGADFSQVKVHTDDNAVQMNRQLNAKAFTNGSDIYFNQGQYNPQSSQGKHLLAHELTHVVQQRNTIQLYRNSGSWNFGEKDIPPTWVEQEFANPRDKTTKPWIKQIDINFTSTIKDSDGNDTQAGTIDIVYSKNGHELSDFSFSISGGSIQVGTTDRGTFKVHRIEGFGYNSGKYSDLSDKEGPRKRYSKAGKPANMHYAVFYNSGEALHIGPLNESSHGCVHVGVSDAAKMRQINYHSVIGLTKVKVTKP
ncbi:eCIS core domain-containing protein [Pseudozobellia thermophila]|uniref:L,D-transpeptidase catalytic domain n=1 Tax=Pseudozobellia thermophila TaxID=192903 RepID=A0A1M6M673_9FLAO|nr:DUF4157 domain-containing protein [Pseudozobellia thermophila]SHJ78927.1 L,D-transpeptidase catalytic domain [Pseudozobellia thermophila]